MKVRSYGLEVRGRARYIFYTNSIWRSNSVDSAGDFESVPLDQLCPTAKKETNMFTRLHTDPWVRIRGWA